MKVLNYIDGKLLAPLSGEFGELLNPATKEVLGSISLSNKEDVDLAVQAAQKAFSVWSKTSKEERSEWLKKIAQGIQEKFSEFAKWESLDSGKPLKLTTSVDIPRSIRNLEFFSEHILNWGQTKLSDQGSGENTITHNPLGVVATISPWNLPLYLFTWKIAPALAAGNTVVAKPSEVTPVTAFMLGKVCKEIGLPAGVLNIVHGLGQDVGEAISQHKEIKAISFTGSTLTGEKIALSAAPTMKKLSLEMGGKNAALVFADCDFEATLEGVLKSSFSNQGQVCLCTSRVYIEKSLYEKFKTAFVKRVKALKQGDPLELVTDQGAVVNEVQYKKVLKAIQTAKDEGGKVLCGGEAFARNGYYIQPTLIEGLKTEAQTNQTEIFGPVACLIPFNSENDVISQTNSSEYGLACSLWTRDKEKAQRVGKSIEAGIIWINCWLLRDLRTPFGGMKNSGRGREGGDYALGFFSEIKNICLNTEANYE